MNISYILLPILTIVTCIFISKENNNPTVDFIKYGEGNQLVILVGGMIGKDNTYLEDMAKELVDSSKCIVIPNFYSTKSKKRTFSEVSVEQFIEDIEELRKKHSAKQISLIGHSFGGTLSLIYSLRYPKSVSSIVLINTGFINSQYYNRSKNSHFHKLIQPKDSAFLLFEEFMQGKISSSILNDKIDSIQIHNLIFNKNASLEIWNNLKEAKVSYGYESRLYFDFVKNPFNLTNSLNVINTKILLINGNNDTYSEKTSNLLLGQLNNIQKISIKNSGHFPWIENPTEFYQSLIKQNQIKIH